MLPQLVKIGGAALNLLFPQRCVGCGEEGALICKSCQKSLPRIMPPICPQCGKFQPSGLICPSCMSVKTQLDGVRSPFRFEGVMREAVHQFKYKNLRSLSYHLAALLADYFVQCSIPGEVLVPVPLHPKRLRERGYNQSLLLAQDLGKLINLPVEDNCLIRKQFIIPQAQTKSVEDRRNNVKQAFVCKNGKLFKKQVILIDDVSTSGATLDACATALKSIGVTSVWALVLTREL